VRIPLARIAKFVKLATRVFAFRESRAPECWIPPGGIDFAPPRLVFKLERVIGAGHIVFRVSGRIEFEHVATIERAIAGEKGPTALDLSDVTLVDRDVVPCLARLKNAGVALENCPAYVRQAMGRFRRAR